MTSKEQPAENYWADDVKYDVKSAARCRLLNRWPRKPGDKVVLFWRAEKQRAKWRNYFKNGEKFWMNNKAIIAFGFRRIWRILQISEGVIHLGLRPLWITPSLICRIFHILLSIIQLWLNMGYWPSWFGQDGWILAKFFFCLFMDQDGVQVNIQSSWPKKFGQ